MAEVTKNSREIMNGNKELNYNASAGSEVFIDVAVRAQVFQTANFAMLLQ